MSSDIVNIVKKDWIDFLVRTERPYQIHVERIGRDGNLWKDKMLPKLKAFYACCMLPELSAPRNGLSPGIREPKEAWVSVLNFYAT